jgi:hypothetical protein
MAWLSSGPPASHKRRLRFHFHHQPEPDDNQARRARSPRLSSDEILSSLRRRPGNPVEEEPGNMETGQVEESEEYQEADSSGVLRDAIAKKIHHRRGFAFFLLFTASSALIYEVLKPRYNLPSITTLTIDLGVSIFSSLPVQIGVVSLIGLLLILRISRRRKYHAVPNPQ